MLDWVRSHQTILLWLAVVSVITLALSAILIPWMVVRIPRDYFTRGRHHALPWSDRHPIVRMAADRRQESARLVLRADRHRHARASWSGNSHDPRRASRCSTFPADTASSCWIVARQRRARARSIGFAVELAVPS